MVSWIWKLLPPVHQYFTLTHLFWVESKHSPSTFQAQSKHSPSSSMMKGMRVRPSVVMTESRRLTSTLLFSSPSIFYGQSKHIPWTVQAHSMDSPSTFHGQSKHIPWTVQVYSMDSPSIFYGQSKHISWTVQGQFKDSPSSSIMKEMWVRPVIILPFDVTSLLPELFLLSSYSCYRLSLWHLCTSIFFSKLLSYLLRYYLLFFSHRFSYLI